MRFAIWSRTAGGVLLVGPRGSLYRVPFARVAPTNAAASSHAFTRWAVRVAPDGRLGSRQDVLARVPDWVALAVAGRPALLTPAGRLVLVAAR